MLLLSLAHASSLLLTNARVVDVDGVREHRQVLIEGQHIVAIEASAEGLEAERVVDLDGATLVPGLMDSHVHVTHYPSEGIAEDSSEERDALLRRLLRSYVAAGVTTVLDTASLAPRMDQTRAWLEEGAAGPRVLWLGEPVAQPGSYLPSVIPDYPSQDSPEALRAHIARQKERGVVGLKVAMEDGPFRSIWPLPEGEWVEALVGAAAELGLPLFAHAMAPEETLRALELQPTALLHSSLYEDDEAIDAVIAAGAPVVTTLFITDASAFIGDAERRFQDPLLEALVPSVLLQRAQDPDWAFRSVQAARDVAMPRVPDLLLRMVAKDRGGVVGRRVEEHLSVVRRLHEGGAPLVMGSDTPGWPILLNMFPGYGSLRELELLEQAGLSPAEVLRAATVEGPELLGLRDTGRVAVGQRADLVVLDEDPMASASAWRARRYVIKEGELRTPAQWLEEP